MEILLTGYSGFVGSHLLQVHPCSLLADEAGMIPLSDKKRMLQCIKKENPEAVIHLAAQANVPSSFQDPRATYETNFYGTLNLLEALKETGFKGTFLFVSSGDVYGVPDSLPFVETMPLKPLNPYAVSKVAGEALCYQWSRTEKFRIIIVRPFNHIGIGQREDFVVPAFAKQIAQIKLSKKQPAIQVGNIEVTRDFTDVRDIIRAYILLVESAAAVSGEIYNICSGREQSVREILLLLLKIAEAKAEIVGDPARYRPVDMPRSYGSYEKLSRATGWQPSISLEQSLKDIWESASKKNYG